LRNSKIALNNTIRIEVCYVEGSCNKVGFLANVKSTTHTDATTGSE